MFCQIEGQVCPLRCIKVKRETFRDLDTSGQKVDKSYRPRRSPESLPVSGGAKPLSDPPVIAP